MKLCISHYTHKSIPVAKFESGGSFSFGDMTSHSFPQKKGMRHQIRLFTPENGFRFNDMTFCVQNRSSRPRIDPHVNLSNFQAQENCFIFKIFGTSR